MAATDRASALPADDSYLSDLLSYGVERLNEEPDRLASERQRAERRARQAAVEHYRAFVGAAECYATVRREVAGIERGLEAMRASLPTLRAGCEAFATEAADTCAICLEPLVGGRGDAHGRTTALPCAHTFHAACIRPWLSEHAECPTCRHPCG